MTTRACVDERLSALTKSELTDSMSERISIVEEAEIPEGLFQIPRSIDSAILAYRLAIESANVETKNKEKSAWTKRDIIGGNRLIGAPKLWEI
jgi:hypothetical protein